MCELAEDSGVTSPLLGLGFSICRGMMIVIVSLHRVVVRTKLFNAYKRLRNQCLAYNKHPERIGFITRPSLLRLSDSG